MPVTARDASVRCLVPAALAIALLATPADPCTRFLWNTNARGIYVGRTMDWPESTEPVITVFPRGMKRDGGKLGDQTIIAENPAKWTSKYGSVVTTVYGIGAADGFNEKGLGFHLLYLTATDFGPRDAQMPGLHAGLWGQYAIDNASNVTEALKLLADVQIVMAEARGRKATVHLALEDGTGDSAIIEYLDGKAVIHHGRQYTIMTNDPPYDEQLELLQHHDFSKPTSDMPLPGNVNPRDRFQRAAYYAALLPEPSSDREAIAGVFAIARNVSVPFGAPYRGFGIYNTEYRTVMDLTTLRYFFELTTSPNVIWIDLTRLSLSPGNRVRTLKPDDITLSGDVTDKLRRQRIELF